MCVCVCVCVLVGEQREILRMRKTLNQVEWVWNGEKIGRAVMSLSTWRRDSHVVRVRKDAALEGNRFDRRLVRELRCLRVCS